MFLGGLFNLAGFRQEPLEVRKHSTSETTYTLKRKLVLLVSTVTSFSNTPLKGIFYIGVSISMLAALYVGYIVLKWMFFAAPPSGWTSVIAPIWLLGGMIISFLGIIGVYLSKVFIETKRRPYSIVRQIYGQHYD
jgi:putative glycosyltransferase